MESLALVKPIEQAMGTTVTAMEGVDGYLDKLIDSVGSESVPSREMRRWKLLVTAIRVTAHALESELKDMQRILDEL